MSDSSDGAQDGKWAASIGASKFVTHTQANAFFAAFPSVRRQSIEAATAEHRDLDPSEAYSRLVALDKAVPAFLWKDEQIVGYFIEPKQCFGKHGTLGGDEARAVIIACDQADREDASQNATPHQLDGTVFIKLILCAAVVVWKNRGMPHIVPGESLSSKVLKCARRMLQNYRASTEEEFVLGHALFSAMCPIGIAYVQNTSSNYLATSEVGDPIRFFFKDLKWLASEKHPKYQVIKDSLTELGTKEFSNHRTLGGMPPYFYGAIVSVTYADNASLYWNNAYASHLRQSMNESGVVLTQPPYGGGGGYAAPPDTRDLLFMFYQHQETIYTVHPRVLKITLLCTKQTQHYPGAHTPHSPDGGNATQMYWLPCAATPEQTKVFKSLLWCPVYFSFETFFQEDGRPAVNSRERGGHAAVIMRMSNYDTIGGASAAALNHFRQQIYFGWMDDTGVGTFDHKHFIFTDPKIFDGVSVEGSMDWMLIDSSGAGFNKHALTQIAKNLCELYKEDGIHKVRVHAVRLGTGPTGAQFGMGDCTIWAKVTVDIIASFNTNAGWCVDVLYATPVGLWRYYAIMMNVAAGRLTHAQAVHETSALLALLSITKETSVALSDTFVVAPQEGYNARVDWNAERDSQLHRWARKHFRRRDREFRTQFPRDQASGNVDSISGEALGNTFEDLTRGTPIMSVRDLDDVRKFYKEGPAMRAAQGHCNDEVWRERYDPKAHTFKFLSTDVVYSDVVITGPPKTDFLNFTDFKFGGTSAVAERHLRCFTLTWGPLADGSSGAVDDVHRDRAMKVSVYLVRVKAGRHTGGVSKDVNADALFLWVDIDDFFSHYHCSARLMEAARKTIAIAGLVPHAAGAPSLPELAMLLALDFGRHCVRSCSKWMTHYAEQWGTGSDAQKQERMKLLEPLKALPLDGFPVTLRDTWSPCSPPSPQHPDGAPQTSASRFAAWKPGKSFQTAPPVNSVLRLEGYFGRFGFRDEAETYYSEDVYHRLYLPLKPQFLHSPASAHYLVVDKQWCPSRGLADFAVASLADRAPPPLPLLEAIRFGHFSVASTTPFREVKSVAVGVLDALQKWKNPTVPKTAASPGAVLTAVRKRLSLTKKKPFHCVALVGDTLVITRCKPEQTNAQSPLVEGLICNLAGGDAVATEEYARKLVEGGSTLPQLHCIFTLNGQSPGRQVMDVLKTRAMHHWEGLNASAFLIFLWRVMGFAERPNYIRQNGISDPTTLGVVKEYGEKLMINPITDHDLFIRTMCTPSGRDVARLAREFDGVPTRISRKLADACLKFYICHTDSQGRASIFAAAQKILNETLANGPNHCSAAKGHVSALTSQSAS